MKRLAARDLENLLQVRWSSSHNGSYLTPPSAQSQYSMVFCLNPTTVEFFNSSFLWLIGIPWPSCVCTQISHSLPWIASLLFSGTNSVCSSKRLALYSLPGSSTEREMPASAVRVRKYNQSVQPRPYNSHKTRTAPRRAVPLRQHLDRALP